MFSASGTRPVTGTRTPLAQRGHDGDDRAARGHVGLHRHHRVARLEREAAGVERDALAHEHDVGCGAAAPRPGGTAARPGAGGRLEPAPTAACRRSPPRASCFSSRTVTSSPCRLPEVAGLPGQPGRVLGARRHVRQVAGQVHRATGQAGPLDRRRAPSAGLRAGRCRSTARRGSFPVSRRAPGARKGRPPAAAPRRGPAPTPASRPRAASVATRSTPVSRRARAARPRPTQRVRRPVADPDEQHPAYGLVGPGHGEVDDLAASPSPCSGASSVEAEAAPSCAPPGRARGGRPARPPARRPRAVVDQPYGRREDRRVGGLRGRRVIGPSGGVVPRDVLLSGRQRPRPPPGARAGAGRRGDAPGQPIAVFRASPSAPASSADSSTTSRPPPSSGTRMTMPRPSLVTSSGRTPAPWRSRSAGGRGSARAGPGRSASAAPSAGWSGGAGAAPCAGSGAGSGGGRGRG